MARLRNVQTGAIVSVLDEKVERLGSQWVSADADAPAKKAPAKKAPAKKAPAKKAPAKKAAPSAKSDE